MWCVVKGIMWYVIREALGQDSLYVRSCACPSRDAPADAPTSSTRYKKPSNTRPRNITRPNSTSNSSRSGNKTTASCSKALGTITSHLLQSTCHVVKGAKSRELKRRHHKHRSSSRRSWETIVQTRQASEGLNRNDVVDEDNGVYKFTASIMTSSCW